MEGYITFNQLGLVITFLLILGIGVYAILVLRNINAVAKDVSVIIRDNREHLNRTFPQVAVVSENAAIISAELKATVGEAGRAIETISRDTTHTVMKVNETADHIATYAIVVGEIAKAVANVFTTDKKA